MKSITQKYLLCKRSVVTVNFKYICMYVHVNIQFSGIMARRGVVARGAIRDLPRTRAHVRAKETRPSTERTKSLSDEREAVVRRVGDW